MTLRSPLDCDGLQSHTFAAHDHIAILGTPDGRDFTCAIDPIVIAVNDVWIRGKNGRVILVPRQIVTPPATSTGIHIEGNNVRVERVAVSGFTTGITVDNGIGGTSIVDASVNNNHYGMSISGDDTCLFNVTAKNNNQDGITVTTDAGGYFEFRSSNADSNIHRGIVVASTSLTHAQVWNSSITSNQDTGLTLAGPDAEVLCSIVRKNIGTGILSTASRLQVENSYIRDNDLAGIDVTGGVTHVLNTTMLDNAASESGRQIVRSGGTLRVYNTIARGSTFIYGGSGTTTECSNNMYSSSTTVCGSSTPGSGSVVATPDLESDQMHLKGGAAVDHGADLSRTAKPTLVARVANQDTDGTPRPLDGDATPGAVNDMGGYEKPPNTAVVGTWTPTSTPKNGRS